MQCVALSGLAACPYGSTFVVWWCVELSSLTTEACCHFSWPLVHDFHRPHARPKLRFCPHLAALGRPGTAMMPWRWCCG